MHNTTKQFRLFSFTLLVFGVLALFPHTGCQETGRPCQSDADCATNGPARFCVQGFCRSQACEAGQQRSCYNGPNGTQGIGSCREGEQICLEDGRWSGCRGQVLPTREICDTIDNDCDGVIDKPDDSCRCQAGESRSCYSGPPDTLRGPCKKGVQVCGLNSLWGPCRGQVLPTREVCDGVNNDCDQRCDANGQNCTDSIDEELICDCEPGTQRRCVQDTQPGFFNCVSQQTCLEDRLWGPCNRQVVPGAIELCDGKDNNCDGQIDEGCECQPGDQRICYPERETGCTGSLSNLQCIGECKAGIQLCERGSWGSCQTQQTPSSELCNGQDDDCDGLADEDFAKKGLQCVVGVGECVSAGTYLCSPDQKTLICDIQPKPPTAEVCDNRDNDCDNKVDETFPRKGERCVVGQGRCLANGSLVCNRTGNSVVCGATPKKKDVESCNGLDDDCDGKNDESLQGCECIPQTTQPCYPASQGCIKETNGFICTAPCSAGSQTCQSDGKWGECTGATVAQEERCNDQDEDCDGQIDETFSAKGAPCSVGTGNCVGTGNYVCNAAGQVQCNATLGTPQPEMCNDVDDDCNGKIDDAAFCGQGRRCVRGRCVLQSSNPACQKTPPVLANEVCDDIDNDCDGKTDEDFPTKDQQCFAGLGDCLRPGRLRCKMDKTGLACDAQPGTPGTEICNNFDNDCDGKADEDFTDKGQPCQAGTGACLRTDVKVCKSDNSGTTCRATPGQPLTELCNNTDDDCDGKTDENTLCQIAGATCTNGVCAP